MSSIKQIKVFIMVADLKSFTGAAESLYMTQPAVSSQIKALEEHVGIPLIERNDKKIELTEAGKQFYREAKNIVSAYDRALEVMDDFRGLKRGRLAIGASTIPGEYLLPRLIGGFRCMYPGIEISLTIGDTQSVLEMLHDRKIDLGVVGAKSEANRTCFIPFLEDELVLIAGTDQEIPSVVSVRELFGREFVFREKGSGTRMALREKLESQGIGEKDFSIVMELGSTRAVITAVEAGLGLGFVSRWAADAVLKAGLVKQILVPDLDMKRDLFIATMENVHTTKARDVFCDYMQGTVLE